MRFCARAYPFVVCSCCCCCCCCSCSCCSYSCCGGGDDARHCCVMILITSAPCCPGPASYPSRTRCAVMAAHAAAPAPPPRVQSRSSAWFPRARIAAAGPWTSPAELARGRRPTASGPAYLSTVASPPRTQARGAAPVLRRACPSTRPSSGFRRRTRATPTAVPAASAAAAAAPAAAPPCSRRRDGSPRRCLRPLVPPAAARHSCGRCGRSCGCGTRTW